MQYYPAFIKLTNERVVFSGAGEHAAAKIRLLLKTQATIAVFGDSPCEDVKRWAGEGRLALIKRALKTEDVVGARLVYGANDEVELDRRAATLGRQAGALTNIVDNLQESDFLTPAIVDRDPVVIAIGTEGTAPILARKIKSDIEKMLPQSTGLLAKLANGFRPVAGNLKRVSDRRIFWTRFFFHRGPQALMVGGEKGVLDTLQTLYAEVRDGSGAPTRGHVDLIGAGPGDPDLLTMKARRKLHDADVVLHDRLVTPEILELARREATVICVGKTGYGASWKQDDINALVIEHASAGRKVARLKSGDPAIYGRLDEEIDALEDAGIDWEIVPGITSASAAAASIGTSLTRRGRNKSLRFLTGRDVDGLAEHDWVDLAQTGSAAALYMGVKASRFFVGRLLMHGADPDAPITIVENVSRMDQRIVETTIGGLPATLQHEAIVSPAILLLGLSPRTASVDQYTLEELAAITGTGG